MCVADKPKYNFLVEYSANIGREIWAYADVLIGINIYFFKNYLSLQRSNMLYLILSKMI